MKMIKKIFVPAITGITALSSVAAVTIAFTLHSAITKEQREIFNIKGDKLIGLNSNLDQNKLKKYCANNRLTLPAVKTISEHAFENLNTPFAKEIVISSETEVIEKFAFYGCTAQSITWDDLTKSKLKQIGNDAFAMCTSLQEIVLPKSIFESTEGHSIGNRCFFGDENISTIDLSYGGDLFAENNTFISNVLEAREPFYNVGSKVTEGGKFKFSDVMAPSEEEGQPGYPILMSIAKHYLSDASFNQINWKTVSETTYTEETPIYQGKDIAKFVPYGLMEYETDQTTSTLLFKGIKKNIPANSENTGPIQVSICFSNECSGISSDCSLFKTPWDSTGTTIGGLESITILYTDSGNDKEFTIPSDLYATDSENDSALEGIQINKVKSIGSNAFKGCKNLSYASFEECGNIFNSAFKDCQNLNYFRVNSKSETPLVTSIAQNAFENAFCNETKDGIFSAVSVGDIGNNAFKSCKKLTLVEANGVLKIGDNAFEECESLVTFSNTESNKLRHVGSNAFLGDSNLWFDISGCTNLIEIGESAFVGVDIGKQSGESASFAVNKNSVVGDKAFYENETLGKVTIANNIENAIGSYAFAGCENLFTIDISSWDDVPDILSTTQNLFLDCGSKATSEDQRIVYIKKDLDDEKYSNIENWLKLQLGDSFYDFEIVEKE